MKAYRTLIAALVISVLSLGLVNIGSASAHPTYKLGKAKICRVGFVKRTETHMVKGKRVRFAVCVNFGPATTTTKGGDPPTAISITPSESPAIVGDLITYSMTVADVLTSTQAAVYMTDNGVKLTGCTGPTPTSQGSLAYSCTETYTSSDTGSHLIAGIFLGDVTYGQSAGQLTEPVDLTAPTTTTTLAGVSAPAPGGASTTTTTVAPTTTTTAAPAPTISVTISGCTASAVNSNLVFTATVSGSAGTPPGINTGFSWSSSGGTLNTNAGGNGYNFASYHFGSPGTFTVTATYTAGYAPGSSGPYSGVSGSASCQVTIS
jgi:hypothetical protein